MAPEINSGSSLLSFRHLSGLPYCLRPSLLLSMSLILFSALVLLCLPLSLAGTSPVVTTSGALTVLNKTCTVTAGGSNLTDDAPAVLEAFQDCGQDGRVIFSNTTYYINSVMNTTGLNNCEVEIHGTLVVSRPISLI